MYTLEEFKINDYGIVQSISNNSTIRNSTLNIGIVTGIVIKLLKIQDDGFLCLVRNQEIFISNDIAKTLTFKEIDS